MRRTILAAAGAAALVLGMAAPAMAQPSGQQYFCIRWGCLWVNPSTGFLQFSGTKHTNFQVWNGSRLEQAGTTKCITYSGPAGYGGDLVMLGCSTSKTSQKKAYIAQSGGNEEVQEVYNRGCWWANASGTNVTAEGCLNGSLNELGAWV